MNATASIAAPEQPRLRPDLVIHPDAETGKGRVVKDPKTRSYYRFDELEGFILGRLDGQHTPIDIQIELVSITGDPYSLEDIYDFLDLLREKGLVEGEGPCLPVQAPALGQQVLLALEQGGFQFRKADDPAPPGMLPARRNLPEAREFDDAVTLLRQGRFQAALRVFDGILAANPDNQRAAAVRQILLQAGQVKVQAMLEGAAKPKNSPFYYRIPLFDPDALFKRLEPKFRFVWTRGFMTLYVGLVALAGWIGLTHHAELLDRIPHLSLTGWAGGLLFAAIFLTAMHEFSHGLTCRHFGGKVPELGFLLIFFFMPALYVDVSDAWLFRRRRDRAFVGMAGPMFDLFVACLALVLWRVLPPGHLASACVLIMTTSGGSVLLNINPLMRLDGYYILSDLAGIPNLRKAALGAVGRGLSALKGKRSPVTLTPQARAFLAVYGVLSAIYIGFILFLMLRMITSLATHLAGIWGPAMLGAGLLLLLRKPLRALGRMLVGSLKTMTLGRLTRVGAAVAIIAAVAMLPWSLRVAGPGDVLARQRVAVRAEVTGNLAQVLVKEGDTVRAGDVVARLDRQDLLAQLAMTRSDVEQASANLRLLVDGPEKEQVRSAREQVRAARAETEQLKSRYERLTRLRQEGLVSTDLYEQVGKELAISEGSLRSATQQARLVEKGARPERIAAAQAEVARLETKAADILRRIAACDLRSPIGGVVVTAKLEARTGERIPAGGTLLEVADTGDLVVDVAVLEAEIGDVENSQPVKLRLAAYPGRVFLGQVEEIAPAAIHDDLGRAEFRVRCTVSDEEHLLRPGMTGSVKIECGRYPLARLIVRRFVRLIDPSLF